MHYDYYLKKKKKKDGLAISPNIMEKYFLGLKILIGDSCLDMKIYPIIG